MVLIVNVRYTPRYRFVTRIYVIEEHERTTRHWIDRLLSSIVKCFSRREEGGGIVTRGERASGKEFVP